MKTIKNVTLYKCEYCNKEYKRIKACEAHEERCSNNPNNARACFVCEHISKIKVDVHAENFYGEASMKRELLYCDKKSVFLHPPLVAFKGNAFLQEDIGDGEKPNNPMPKTCNDCTSTLFSSF